jgi:sugar phosphate permease
LQNLAAAILVFRLTHSALLLGVLSFVQFAPTLFLAPWTGSAADRFDRRRLLLVVQPAAALLSATLALLTHFDVVTAPLVIVLGLGQGLMTAFSTPAQQALFVSLVTREDVTSAVGLNSMTFNIARAEGPALAGATIGTLGIAAAFAVDSCSYLVFALALVFVGRADRSGPRARGYGTASTSCAESRGLRWRRDRGRRRLQLRSDQHPVAGLRACVRPPRHDRRLHHRRVRRRRGHGRVRPGRSRAVSRPDGDHADHPGRRGGGVRALSFPAPRSRLSLRRRLRLPRVEHLCDELLQLGVAENQRGRIMALWSIALLGLRPFASLVDGAIAASFGVRAAGVALSIPALAAALLARWRPQPRPTP